MKPRVLFFTLLAFILNLNHVHAQEDSIQPLWREAIGGTLVGKPQSMAGSIAFLVDDGTIKNYSSNGRQLWTFYAGGKLGPFLSRSREGSSYIQRTDGTFIAVNRSGRKLWEQAMEIQRAAPIVGWDGRIFISVNTQIHCYTASGYKLWSRDLGSPIHLGPYEDGQGGILCSTHKPALVQLDPFGTLTQIELDSSPSALAALPQKRQDTESKEFAIFYPGGKAELLSLNGDRSSLPDAGGTAVLAKARGMSLAVYRSDATLVHYSLDPINRLWFGDGPPVYHDETTEAQKADLLYDERGIYVLGNSGAAGFTEDGRRLWIINIQGSAASPSFSDNGVLYSGGKDWVLYAYKLEERIRIIPQSLYGPAPEGSYGIADHIYQPDMLDYFLFSHDLVKAELESIQNAVLAHEVGNREKDFSAYLMLLAGSGRTIRSPRDAMHPSVLPQHRSMALELLGNIGSREHIAFLSEVLLKDPDTTVQAAAAMAIGKIGVDPEGTALTAIASILHRSGLQGDESLLYALAGACGSLCRFSGPPLSGAGVKLLMQIAEDERYPAVRSKAMAEIQSLTRKQ